MLRETTTNTSEIDYSVTAEGLSSATGFAEQDTLIFVNGAERVIRSFDDFDMTISIVDGTGPHTSEYIEIEARQMELLGDSHEEVVEDLSLINDRSVFIVARSSSERCILGVTRISFPDPVSSGLSANQTLKDLGLILGEDGGAKAVSSVIEQAGSLERVIDYTTFAFYDKLDDKKRDEVSRSLLTVLAEYSVSLLTSGLATHGTALMERGSIYI